MAYDVFICYARKDGIEFADRLERSLSAHGYGTWRDKRNLDVYQDFTAEIEIGIRESRFVVVCVSPSIEQNPYSFVRREISYARSKNKPIIPLVLPNADLPLDIINLTWVGCFDGQKPAQTLAYERGFADLLTRLQHDAEPGSRPATSSDPYRDYVESLYEGVIDILDQTMIKLIDVRGQSTPEAVQGQPQRHNPVAAFKGRYGMKPEAVETPVASFREAYEKYQGRVLLLGEPGAGKSTTLLAFARDAAAARLSDPTQPLPLLARCAMWDSSAKTPILEWVAQSAGLPAAELVPLVQAKKTILLLDALDELGGERIERKKAPDGQDIEDRYDPRKRFIPLLPNDVPLVISCRVTDYAELGEKLPLNGAVTLQPLTDEQIHAYLSDVPGLWEVVSADAALLDVARTPLLLSLIAFAFRDAPVDLKTRGDLSEVGLRNFIFERYVRERYEFEQNRSDVPLPFTLEEIHDVLGHVAMINASGDTRYGYIDSQITENVIEVRDFMPIPAAKIGEFISFAVLLDLLYFATDNSLRFVHLKLRDYFAYSYCLPRLNEQSLYTETSRPSPAKALGTIADEPAVMRLIELLNDKNAQQIMRQSATYGLSKTHTPIALSSLLTVLQDKSDSEDVRSSIAQALEEFNGREVMRTLITLLEDKNEKEYVRYSAADALKSIYEAQVQEALINRILDTSEVRNVRSLSIGSLGSHVLKTGDINIRERVYSVLISVIQNRNDKESIRSSSLRALGRIGSKIAASLMLSVFQDTTEPEYVRTAALETLDQLGEELSLSSLVDVLHNKQEDIEVRSSVVYPLAKIGNEGALAEMLKVLHDKKDNDKVRDYIMSALSDMGVQQVLDTVIAILKDKNDANMVRSTAIHTLGEVNSEIVLETLINVLYDKSDDKTVRQSAIYELSKIGNERARNAIISLLDDKTENNEVCYSAIRALGKIGCEMSISALIELLNDTTMLHAPTNTHICDIAANTLEDIGTLKALTALEAWRATQDKND
jgi:HEAT repeat protein